MKKPSEIKRDDMRATIRAALPSSTALRDLLGDRRVNDLPMTELETLANVAQGSLDATYGSARAGLAPQESTETKREPAEAPTSQDTAAPVGVTADEVEAEVATIRGLVVSGGFTALDERLRELVRASHKPAVEVERIVERTITVEVPPPGTRPIHRAAQLTSNVTWREAFGVPGALGNRTTHLWDGTHPNTPRVDYGYQWPQPETGAALTQIARGKNVLLYGPAGAGKTAWAEQLAARLGRPFALISCNENTDASTLLGMTAPANGATIWQDGALTRAIRTPGTVVCIDEPSIARPGAHFVMQNLLANRVLWVDETGERVPCAKGVIFVSADNTNGTGGGARRGFAGTQRLNDAFLDRFGARVDFGYLPADQEAGVLADRTGCTAALARLLVSAATTTRAAAQAETLSKGIGLRRLFAWAEMLTDGVAPDAAFRYAILNSVPESEVEALQQQVALTVDAQAIDAALQGSN